MNKIYFLKIMCDFNKEEHYENVYSTKEKAFEQGMIKLEEIFREEYDKMFEDDAKETNPKLTHEQLFKMQAIYDFSITEFDPEFVDNTYDANNLPVVETFDLELFLDAYNYLKSDLNNIFLNYYTNEGLKLAGFLENDLKK